MICTQKSFAISNKNMIFDAQYSTTPIKSRRIMFSDFATKQVLSFGGGGGVGQKEYR